MPLLQTKPEKAGGLYLSKKYEPDLATILRCHREGGAAPHWGGGMFSWGWHISGGGV